MTDIKFAILTLVIGIIVGWSLTKDYYYNKYYKERLKN
jgi:hypothetical protein